MPGSPEHDTTADGTQDGGGPTTHPLLTPTERIRALLDAALWIGIPPLVVIHVAGFPGGPSLTTLGSLALGIACAAIGLVLRIKKRRNAMAWVFRTTMDSTRRGVMILETTAPWEPRDTIRREWDLSSRFVRKTPYPGASPYAESFGPASEPKRALPVGVLMQSGVWEEVLAGIGRCGGGLTHEVTSPKPQNAREKALIVVFVCAWWVFILLGTFFRRGFL